MKPRVVLAMRDSVRHQLWRHLLPRSSQLEQAAFGFAAWESENHAFRLDSWYRVPCKGFVVQTEISFELTDEVRAAAIKRAHDLDTSLVEFHSHRLGSVAQFSASDLAGFSDFVPHVWWRLKGKPYLAIVVARGGFDGTAWISEPSTGLPIYGIMTNDRLLRAGHSSLQELLK
jgi:hypothetical protein